MQAWLAQFSLLFHQKIESYENENSHFDYVSRNTLIYRL